MTKLFPTCIQYTTLSKHHAVLLMAGMQSDLVCFNKKSQISRHWFQCVQFDWSLRICIFLFQKCFVKYCLAFLEEFREIQMGKPLPQFCSPWEREEHWCLQFTCWQYEKQYYTDHNIHIPNLWLVGSCCSCPINLLNGKHHHNRTGPKKSYMWMAIWLFTVCVAAR